MPRRLGFRLTDVTDAISNIAELRMYVPTSFPASSRKGLKFPFSTLFHSSGERVATRSEFRCERIFVRKSFRYTNQMGRGVLSFLIESNLSLLLYSRFLLSEKG